MSLVIGLTGSIASGKSTVSNMFKELHIPVIDADIVAREVVEPGENAYQKVVETFGEIILHPDQTINRKRLGKIVFANSERRQQLNNIVHPAVRQKMLAQKKAYIAQKKPCIVLDIPLLFESKLQHFVDKTLVVYVDQEVQLARLVDRDQSTAKEALQRINAQMPGEKKAAMADAVINNNGTVAQTKQQLLAILVEWGVLSKEQR